MNNCLQARGEVFLKSLGLPWVRHVESDSPPSKDLYARRRKGAFSDDQWARIEGDIASALKEGRVIARPFWTK
jgi:hypothetical protein